MSRFDLPFRGSVNERIEGERRQAQEEAAEVQLRAARLRGMLSGEAWQREIGAYMDAYVLSATSALVERSLSDEDRGVLRGKALAFRDLRNWINGILAAADEARRAASDEQDEAGEASDNPASRRF